LNNPTLRIRPPPLTERTNQLSDDDDDLFILTDSEQLKVFSLAIY